MEGIGRYSVLSSYVDRLVPALYLLGMVAQPGAVLIFCSDLHYLGVIYVGWAVTDFLTTITRKRWQYEGI